MSTANTFTGAELDRAADGRRTDTAWVEAQRSDPRARTVRLGDPGIRVSGGALELIPLVEADLAGLAEPVLLGLDGRGPVWALDEDPPPADPRRPGLIGALGRRDVVPLPRAAGWMGLREAASALTRPESGLAAYATGLLNWHRSHRFCANCGAPTEHAEGGHVRTCPRCGSHHHPRTDPVVIMLVTGRPGVLLGRQPSWPDRRYSALAGFVGPGESLEEAVAREVEEEAGVEVGRPAYVSSQPWPFPASLMLGFTVPYLEGEPGGRDPELQDVRWFSRDEVAEAASRDLDWEGEAPAGAPLQLPPRTAIARRLIDGWLEGS
jgi:NAD+ diphosphatase